MLHILVLPRHSRCVCIFVHKHKQLLPLELPRIDRFFNKLRQVWVGVYAGINPHRSLGNIISSFSWAVDRRKPPRAKLRPKTSSLGPRPPLSPLPYKLPARVYLTSTQTGGCKAFISNTPRAFLSAAFAHSFVYGDNGISCTDLLAIDARFMPFWLATYSTSLPLYVRIFSFPTHSWAHGKKAKLF